MFQSESIQRYYLSCNQGETTETMDARLTRGAVEHHPRCDATAAHHPRDPQRGDIPQIVAFDNEGLLGDHIHIFGNTPDLGKWGNSISSMVILSGHWEFFDEEKLQGTKVELGPGIDLHVKDHGLRIIVSPRCASWAPPHGAVTYAACARPQGPQGPWAGQALTYRMLARSRS